MSGNKNITLDDPSPLLTYVGNWDGDDHEGDPFIDRYSNSTFHASSTLGDSMKFNFEGNGIWLFGAFRSNHEYYSTSIDGSPKIYNTGYRPVDVFTQVLYSNSMMHQGRHEVVLTNERGYNGTAPGEGYGWLDLDFIMYQTSSSPSGEQTKMEEMVFTTGTPRVQLHFPTGTPRPITISSSSPSNHDHTYEVPLIGFWILATMLLHLFKA